MTVYCGIDIAKELHYALIVNHDGVASNPFSFENNSKGFNLLLSHLSSYPIEDLIIGYESTAHYQDNLANFLKTRGFKTSLINPLQTSALRKANIRNTKTDRVDAKIIAIALMQLDTHIDKSNEMHDLYLLCTMRDDLMKKRSTCKIQFVSVMDRIFPELASFFKNNLHLNTAYRLIEKYTLPSQIIKTRIDSLTKLLYTASHGKYARSKALELKSLAEISVGIPSDIFAFQAQELIHQIEFYTEQIQLVEEKISSYPALQDSVILSIPGINSIFAAYILSCIKNITDFDGSDKLVAFSGLDPIVRQSGKFNAAHTRMSKRGNRLLRYALIWTSWNVVRNNQTFYDYYKKKRLEGKSHYNALGHCAKKLIKSIYYMLSRNEKFNLA